MRKKSSDFLNQLVHFQQDIIKNKPETKVMIEEVRMMRFRIRPLDGDITQINFNNMELLETLWNLGKIDEFFQKEHHKIKDQEKQVFYHFIDKLYQKFQMQLNKIRLEPSALIEMEIFKDKPQIH